MSGGIQGRDFFVKGGGAWYLLGISFTKGGGVQYRNISISLSVTIYIISISLIYHYSYN